MNAISMLSLPETQNQNPWQDSFTLERNTCRMKLAYVNNEEHTVLFVVTVSFQPSVNLKNMLYYIHVVFIFMHHENMSKGK